MRNLLCLVVLVLFVAIPAEAFAQQHNLYYFCRPGEDKTACRNRLCKPGETLDECYDRLKEEQEEREKKEAKEREKREEKARKEREEREEREKEEREKREKEQEKSQKERERDRDRGRDRDRDRREREQRERRRSSSGSSSGGSDVLRPATHPFFFAGAIGPTFHGLNRWGHHLGRGRGLVALDMGFHLGDDFEGPALGFTIEQSFSEYFYVFNPAFKFWWDIMPSDEYGIYIAPFAKAGYALAACDLHGYCGPDHAFNFGTGVEGRLVLGDRGLVLVRPLQLDAFIGNFFHETFWLSYSVLIGGGVIF